MPFVLNTDDPTSTNQGERAMPIYKAQDLKATPDIKNPNVSMIQFGGELIKVGIVTYQSGRRPPAALPPQRRAVDLSARGPRCLSGG